MSLNRMPFQSVNDSRMEATVGIQTSPTCRRVGMPSIASTTQRSRPSNCRSRRVVGAAMAAGGFWTWAAVANAALASLREENVPAAQAAAGVIGFSLLREDDLGLGLHLFQDSVDAGRIGQEVGERLTGHVRGELRTRVAVQELRHCRRRGDRLEDLLLQRTVERDV